MADFEIQRAEDTVQVHLRLKGDLDLYNAPAFDDALVAVEGEKWPTLVLDLRELEFLDSMALRLIMRTQARAKQDGRRLVVVRGRAFVDRVLKLSGLEEHLELVDEPPVAETA
jgi:anti-anti-sigma factor